MGEYAKKKLSAQNLLCYRSVKQEHGVCMCKRVAEAETERAYVGY